MTASINICLSLFIAIAALVCYFVQRKLEKKNDCSVHYSPPDAACGSGSARVPAHVQTGWQSYRIRTALARLVGKTADGAK